MTEGVSQPDEPVDLGQGDAVQEFEQRRIAAEAELRIAQFEVELAVARRDAAAERVKLLRDMLVHLTQHRERLAALEGGRPPSLSAREIKRMRQAGIRKQEPVQQANERAILKPRTSPPGGQPRKGGRPPSEMRRLILEELDAAARSGRYVTRDELVETLEGVMPPPVNPGSVRTILYALMRAGRARKQGRAWQSCGTLAGDDR